ncbi:hypothetical protein ER308_16115 [Egibacter rhizosphaerae]|uniref:Uncharacterized protein n=1 Tax=Egibacter rhizosphaerae TaxID=1670831 RepID=A0A411YIC5_9ACTN|nr:hypothetical protein [Egibacter rhizosphaerae]QBI20947.1 hypothetical protein ER308_16115 [Egibacter rhizosphaerae]
MGRNEEGSRRRWGNIAGIALGVVLVIGVGFGRIGGTLPIGGDTDPRASCDDPVAWDAVDGHEVGTEVAVEGPVEAASTEPDLGGAPTFLNLGNAYPDEPRFDVVVYESEREGLGFDPEQALPGERICAVGELDERDGVPQIVLPAPGSLRTDLD